MSLSIPFSLSDLKVYMLAVDGLHKVVAVPVEAMGPFVAAKRKLALALQAAEAEEKGKADGNGTETPKLTEAPALPAEE